MTGIPSRFWRELAAVLAAKAVLLTILYFAFFSGPAPAIDVGAHLFAVTGSR